MSGSDRKDSREKNKGRNLDVLDCPEALYWFLPIFIKEGSTVGSDSKSMHDV